MSRSLAGHGTHYRRGCDNRAIAALTLEDGKRKYFYADSDDNTEANALAILVSLGWVVVPCRSPRSGTLIGPASGPRNGRPMISVPAARCTQRDMKREYVRRH